MRCPVCNHYASKVAETREKIKRRRECFNPKCKARWTTTEVLVPGSIRTKFKTWIDK